MLLIGAGANVNTVAPSELTPLGACLDRFGGRVSEEESLRGLERVVRALLRAGALLHACHAGYAWGTARWLLDLAGYETVHNPSGAWPRCKVLVEGVREAESYKAFFARRRRDVLTLRALALKGRAKTSDAVLGSVFGLPDGVAWNVLSFWRVARKKIVPEWGYADLGAIDSPAMGPMLTQTEISLNQAKLRGVRDAESQMCRYLSHAIEQLEVSESSTQG